MLLIVLSIVLPITCLVIFIIFYKIRNIMKGVSKQIFQVGTLAEVVTMQNDLMKNIPKSVSGGDSMYINSIKKDFPEFNLDNEKTKVIVFLKNFYLKDNNFIKENYSEDIAILQKSCNIIGLGVSNVDINKCVLFKYNKNYDSANVIFQISYCVNGDCGPTQLRTNIHITFKLSADESSIRCFHCGAPISQLGIKTCTYCGNIIIYDSNLAWKIINIEL